MLKLQWTSALLKRAADAVDPTLRRQYMLLSVATAAAVHIWPDWMGWVAGVMSDAAVAALAFSLDTPLGVAYYDNVHLH